MKAALLILALVLAGCDSPADIPRREALTYEVQTSEGPVFVEADDANVDFGGLTLLRNGVIVGQWNQGQWTGMHTVRMPEVPK